jgi:hypothetical protein
MLSGGAVVLVLLLLRDALPALVGCVLIGGYGARRASSRCAPATVSRTASVARSAPRVLGGGFLHQAVEDICWIYQGRDLAENLRRYGWREARRKVMRQGPPNKEWISHRGKPPVRLARSGIEVKLPGGVQTVSWKRMQSQIRARRS